MDLIKEQLDRIEEKLDLIIRYKDITEEKVERLEEQRELCPEEG